MFLVSVGTLQFLVLGALDAIDSPWVVQGWAGLPFALMALFAYIGVRIFAKLVDIQSIFTSMWVALGSAVGMGVVILALTQALQGRLDISTAMNAYQAAILAITAILMIQIRQTVGPLYAAALNWSLAHYFILTMAGVADVVSRLALPPEHWYNVYNIGTIPYFVAGLCGMAAAIYFNRIAYAEHLNAAPAAAASQGTVTAVDVVVFLAGFVSDQNRVDSILDKMRSITATMEPGKPLSADQQRTLASTYLALEDFLVNKENVRQYKQSDLRQMVELRFRQAVDEQFWRNVEAGQTPAVAQTQG
jgi:hypothetical protein